MSLAPFVTPLLFAVALSVGLLDKALGYVSPLAYSCGGLRFCVISEEAYNLTLYSVAIRPIITCIFYFLSVLSVCNSYSVLMFWRRRRSRRGLTAQPGCALCIRNEQLLLSYRGYLSASDKDSAFVRNLPQCFFIIHFYDFIIS